jgi:nucleoside-diphosphate-sugar epimerase
VVFGEQFWRPYCHVYDLARSVLAALAAEESTVAFDVFNVGDDEQNYQKGTIVKLLIEEIPTARVRYVHKDEDPRDYRVTFKKIQERLGFEITKTVPDGIREIRNILDAGFIPNPDDSKYYNVPPAQAKAA